MLNVSDSALVNCSVAAAAASRANEKSEDTGRYMRFSSLMNK